MSRSRSCTRSAGITRFVRLQKTPFFRREVRPSAAMRLRGGIVKIDMHRGSTTREDSQIAFINEQVLAQSHEDCSFCPRGCGASRRRTATCSSSRMSSRRTMLRTLRTALGLCVGAMGVSAAGSPESARAATGVWPSDSPESVRMQGIKARFGNVSPHAGTGPAGFSLLCSAAGPCWMPRAGATNPAWPSASTVAGACADTPYREWSVSGGAWAAACWCSSLRGAVILGCRLGRRVG